MRYRTEMAFVKTKLLLSLLSLTLLIASSAFADDENTENPVDVTPLGDGHVPGEEGKSHGSTSAKPDGHGGSASPDLDSLDEEDEGTSEALSAEAQKYKSNAKNMTDKIKEMNATSDTDCDIGLHEKLGEFIKVYKEDEKLAFHREDTVYAELNKIYDEKLAKAEKFCEDNFVCSDGSKDTGDSEGGEEPGDGGTPSTPSVTTTEPAKVDPPPVARRRRAAGETDKSNSTSTPGKCKACFEKSGNSHFVLSFSPFKSDGSENSDYKQCFNMAKPNPVINIQGSSGIVSPFGVMSLLSTALMGLVAFV